MGRVPSLDGLRGLAVALVVLSHLSLSGMPVIPGMNFAGAGFYGVCLFFTLSAYLLTSLLLKNSREELRNTDVWRQYLARRVLRIYPFYTFVLLATFFAFSGGAGFVDPMTLGGVLDHLSLRAGSGVFWTIPVECLFYLLLPVIVLAGTAIPQRPLAVAVAGVLLAGLVVGVNTFFPSDSRMALWKNLPAFLGGVYAAWAYEWIEGSLRHPDSRLRIAVEGAGWLALAAVFLHLPSLWNLVSGNVIALDRFHDEPGRFGALWTVLLIATIHGSGALRRALCLKPLRFLGAISFSVYLLHFPVLRAVGSWMPDSPTLAAWTSIAITGLLAFATYLTIEKPFMEFGRTRRSASLEATFTVPA